MDKSLENRQKDLFYFSRLWNEILNEQKNRIIYETVLKEELCLKNAHDKIEEFSNCMEELSKKVRKDTNLYQHKFTFIFNRLQKCFVNSQENSEFKNCIFDAEYDLKKILSQIYK